MKLFTKTRQVAFISYTLGACYVADSLAQFPGSIAIKGDGGTQIWL